MELKDVVDSSTSIDKAGGNGRGQDGSSHWSLVTDGEGQNHNIDKLRDKRILV